MSTPADEIEPDLPLEGTLPQSTTEHITSVAHYYRGELSRMISWRDRLDHTTNWAIAASAAMLSVALSSPGSHHAVILCCMVVVFLLLWIEARRYRFFDVSRRRTRILERNYYSRLFVREVVEDPPDWRERLSADLKSPRFSLTISQAIRNRLRRNYIWIYLTLMVSWWLKVSTVVLEARTGKARFVEAVDQLLVNARVSYIPGGLVIAGVALFFVWLMFMVFAPKEASCGGKDDEADV